MWLIRWSKICCFFSVGLYITYRHYITSKKCKAVQKCRTCCCHHVGIESCQSVTGTSGCASVLCLCCVNINVKVNFLHSCLIHIINTMSCLFISLDVISFLFILFSVMFSMLRTQTIGRHLCRRSVVAAVYNSTNSRSDTPQKTDAVIFDMGGVVVPSPGQLFIG